MGGGESKKYLGSATNAASPLKIALPGQAQSQIPLPEGRPGAQTTVKGETAELPSPLQRRTWFQGCGSKTGKRIPYLEKFSLAADPVLPASEPSGPRPLFPAVDGGLQ